MKHMKPRSIFVYLVACVGIHDTYYAKIRLREADKRSNAERIARQQVPGRLAYHVQSVEPETY